MKSNWGIFFTLSISTIATLLILYARVNILFIYNPDTGGLEYELIYEIQRLLENSPLYSDINLPPFQITQKTPLYHLMIYYLAKIIGITADDIYKLFVLSRFFTLTMVFSTCILCYKIARNNFTLPFWLSVLFSMCALFIMSHSHHYHSRMDVIYLLLFLLKYFLLNKYQWKLTPFSLIFSIIFSVLIFYTKQNGLVMIPLISYTFYLQKQPAKLIFSYASMSIFLIILLPFISTVDVHLFFENIFLGINNGIILGGVKRFFTSQFQLFFVLLSFIGLYFLHKKRNIVPYGSILIGFTLFSFILGTVMSFKYGAGLNYFTEFKLLSCLVIIVTFFKYQVSSRFLSKIKTLFLFTFISLTAIMGVKQYYTSSKTLSYNNNKGSYLDQKEIKNFMLADSLNQSVKYIYIQKPEFTINLFHDQVLLPTESVFTPSFKNGDGAQLNFLKKQLEKNIATHIILPDSVDINTFDLFGYTFEKYKKIKSIHNYDIYHYTSKEK